MWWRCFGFFRVGLGMNIDDRQNHIMVDLETLGTGPNAAVVAIGAVRVFAGSYPVHAREFYRRVDWQSSVDAGGQMEVETVRWWMRQGAAAVGEVCADDGVPLYQALHALTWFMRGQPGVAPDLGDVVLWGNGAAFDNVILAASYRSCDERPPWKFWNDRCYRTLKNLFPDVPYQKPTLAHHALHDARAQAAHLVAIKERMEGDPAPPVVAVEVAPAVPPVLGSAVEAA